MPSTVPSCRSSLLYVELNPRRSTTRSQPVAEFYDIWRTQLTRCAVIQCILSVIGALFKSGAESMTGSVNDPDNPKEVAGKEIALYEDLGIGS